MKNCVNTVAAWVAHGLQDTNIPIATGMQGRDFWVKRNGWLRVWPAPRKGRAPNRRPSARTVGCIRMVAARHPNPRAARSPAN
jgi:hypothetical protein